MNPTDFWKFITAKLRLNIGGTWVNAKDLMHRIFICESSQNRCISEAKTVVKPGLTVTKNFIYYELLSYCQTSLFGTVLSTNALSKGSNCPAGHGTKWLIVTPVKNSAAEMLAKFDCPSFLSTLWNCLKKPVVEHNIAYLTYHKWDSIIFNSMQNLIFFLTRPI